MKERYPGRSRAALGLTLTHRRSTVDNDGELGTQRQRRRMDAAHACYATNRLLECMHCIPCCGQKASIRWRSKAYSLKSEIELGAAAASIHHVACFALLCLHGKARTLHAYRRHHAFSRYLWPAGRPIQSGRPVCLAMMQRTTRPARSSCRLCASFITRFP